MKRPVRLLEVIRIVEKRWWRLGRRLVIVLVWWME